MPAIPLDPQGRLDADIPCVHCGYNLRTTDPTGACPECGTPMDESIRPDLLFLADSGWLRHILAGLSWVRWGVFSVVAMSTFTLVWLLLTRGPHPNSMVEVWMNFFLLILNLVSFAGWFVVTAPSRQVDLLVPDPYIRWLLRVAAVCLSLAMVAFMLFTVWRNDPAATLAAGLFLSPLGSCWAVALGLAYLRSLSLRTADYVLALRFQWLSIVTFGLLLVSSATMLLLVLPIHAIRSYDSPIGPWLVQVILITALITWPILLILCALSLFQIDRLRRDIAAILPKPSPSPTAAPPGASTIPSTTSFPPTPPLSRVLAAKERVTSSSPPPAKQPEKPS
ncbi:MAG: hypothetical protein IT441_10725 [Phycisphaeraceae bacterium]|nr:hypothetical protein [Phycisphaeraceae bacterium]